MLVHELPKELQPFAHAISGYGISEGGRYTIYLETGWQVYSSVDPHVLRCQGKTAAAIWLENDLRPCKCVECEDAKKVRDLPAISMNLLSVEELVKVMTRGAA